MNRSRGWIQDSGSLDKLIKVVELFDKNTAIYKAMVNQIITAKIQDNEVSNMLVEDLKKKSIKHSSLVGSRTSNHEVDSIIQCLLPGQNRVGIVNWACDNFVRFAYTLDFIKHDEETDSYSITDFGLELTKAKNKNEKYEILKVSFKKYPPVIRVLELLYEQFTENEKTPSLTKFEIGSKLGFKGEDGFTTYSQNVFIQAVSLAKTTAERNKIKQNWEGSSDKYARMICGWLMNEHISWVKRGNKEIKIQIGNEEFKSKFQSYQITMEGIKEFKSCRAFSSNSGTTKNVSFEMLSTKVSDKNFLRIRRTLILKSIKNAKTIEQIQSFLERNNLPNITEETIKDDLKNFSRIGLDISSIGSKFKLKDNIELLELPNNLVKEDSIPSYLETVKQNLRSELDCLDHSFLDILDFIVGGRRNAIRLEVRIVELLNQIIVAKHLSGGNRPEIIGYNPENNPDDCLIFDSKAYKDGFQIPASERDKMIRYIVEYNEKNDDLNSNKWWENFKSPNYPSKQVKYGFISSLFIGNYLEQLNYISNRTNNSGSAITGDILLTKVNNVLSEYKNYDINNFFEEIGCNKLLN